MVVVAVGGEESHLNAVTTEVMSAMSNCGGGGSPFEKVSETNCQKSPKNGAEVLHVSKLECNSALQCYI